MKRNLLLGIIGGAAIGAAASYLLDSENRRGLTSGLSNRFNNLLGSEEEETEGTNVTGTTTGRASTVSGRAGGNLGGAVKRRGTTGRRG